MVTTSKEGKGSEAQTETIQHKRSRRALWAVVGVVAVVALIVAYGALSGWFSPSSTASQNVTLQGAGSSFVYPLMSKWASVYNSSSVRVNYLSVGSGAGISDLEKKTVDFAGSDAPLQPADFAAAPNALHIPESIGAVTFAYNIPGIPASMKVNGTVLAGIFLGRITNWDDANLSNLNPALSLPNLPITVVHRSDSSGTTFVFTGYLSQVNATWNATVGTTKNPGTNWPVGIAEPQNAGVAGKILQTSGACGYVELAYTIQNSMTVAAVENPAHNYIMPTLNSTSAAAAGKAPSLPTGAGNWSAVSILNAPGADSYPISTFTYLIVYKELNVEGSVMTSARAQALVNFLWWVVHDGQNYSASLVYVPLPKAVVTIDEASINSITLNGQALRA